MENKERTEDDEFKRTGVFRAKIEINVTVTEEDLLKDLVKKTVGKNLKSKTRKGFENN